VVEEREYREYLLDTEVPLHKPTVECPKVVPLDFIFDSNIEIKDFKVTGKII